MKKYILLITSMILVFGVFGFSDRVTDMEKPEPNANIIGADIPDTKEAKDIMKAIEKAYDVEIKAARSFDLSKFSTVFINDPRFNVDPYTLDVVREMTNRPDLESAGWLDYKMAYYSWRSEAILNAETIKAKAKAENRDLTEEEINSLVDSHGRSAPSRSFGSPKKPNLTFISMDVKDDIALVVLDDGTYTAELTLVLVDGEWYIAAFNGISVNV